MNLENVSIDQLHAVHAGGFSATADGMAFNAITKELWFLSMVGSQQALKAISACLLNGTPKPLHYSPINTDDPESDWNFQQLHLAQASIGTWHTKVEKIPNARAFHSINWTALAEYDNENPTFVILSRYENTNMCRFYYRYLDRRASVPIHESWTTWLWERGRKNGEIIHLASFGMTAFLCTPNEEELRLDIAQGVRSGVLQVREAP